MGWCGAPQSSLFFNSVSVWKAVEVNYLHPLSNFSYYFLCSSVAKVAFLFFEIFSCEKLAKFSQLTKQPSYQVLLLGPFLCSANTRNSNLAPGPRLPPKNLNVPPSSEVQICKWRYQEVQPSLPGLFSQKSRKNRSQPTGTRGRRGKTSKLSQRF